MAAKLVPKLQSTKMLTDAANPTAHHHQTKPLHFIYDLKHLLITKLPDAIHVILNHNLFHSIQFTCTIKIVGGLEGGADMGHAKSTAGLVTLVSG